MNRLSKAEFVQVLVAEEHLAEAAIDRVHEALQRDPSDDDQPWFLKLLQGAGGWVTSLVLLFGFLVFIYESPTVEVGLGTITFVGALYFERRGQNSSFVGQLCLSAVLVGLGLATFGLFQMTRSLPLVMVVAAATSSLGVYLGRAWVTRWLLALGCLSCVGVLVFDQGDSRLFALSIFLLTVAGAVVKLMACEMSMRNLFGDCYGPIRAAFVLFLIGLSGLELALRSDSNGPNGGQVWLLAVGFAMLFVIVIRHVLKDLKLSTTDGRGLGIQAVALLVCACLAVAPGGVASLILLTLAIRARDRLVLGVSIVALLCFGGQFYYAMEYGLLLKSMMLIGAGVLMILAGTRINREVNS
jgi:hypothetical protein